MLGQLLMAAGDAVSNVDSRLRRIAARWGDPDTQMMVLPRVVVLASASGAQPRVVARGADEPGLRLDQAGAVFEVARAVQRGLGVLMFAAGIALMRSAPRRELPWLLLVLAAPVGAQLAGSAVIRARLSGFAGGLAATLVAVMLERFRTAPPAFVSFLPAFWLLAPGGDRAARRGAADQPGPVLGGRGLD